MEVAAESSTLCLELSENVVQIGDVFRALVVGVTLALGMFGGWHGVGNHPRTVAFGEDTARLSLVTSPEALNQHGRCG